MFGSAPAVVIGTASGYAVHNLRTGKAEGQNPGGTWPVPRAAAVRAVSDNRLLLSGSTVVVVGEKGDVWTFRGQFARAYTEKHTFIRSGGYEAFTVSPDRTRLAAVTGFGEAVFWEVTGPQPRALPWTVPGPVTFLRYSVDGRTLVVGDDRTLALWDAAAGKRLWAADLPARRVRDVRFLAGGRRLLVEAVRNAPPDATPAGSFGSSGGSGIGAWESEPGGLRLVPAGRAESSQSPTPFAQVFDAGDGRAFGAPVASVCGFESTPGGSLVLAAGGMRAVPITRALDAATGDEVANPQLPGDPWRAIKSADWRYYLDPDATPGVSFGPGPGVSFGYRVRDGRTGRPLGPTLPATPAQLAGFSADGRFVLVGGRVYESATGVPVTRPPDDPNAALPAEVRPVPGLSRPGSGVSSTFTPADPGAFRPPVVVWEWAAPADARPAEELRQVAVVAAGREIDEGGGLTKADGDTLTRLAAGLEAKHPGGAAVSRAVRLGEVLAEADRLEAAGDLPGAAAWLDRAVGFAPGDAELRTRRNRVRLAATTGSRSADFGGYSTYAARQIPWGL